MLRKIFGPIDNILIECLFQPISDAMTNRFGISRRWIACFCVDLASLAWIVLRAGQLSDAVTDWNASAAFVNVILLLFGLAALISLRTLFRRARTTPRNPLRKAMQPHRGIVLLMLLVRVTQLQTPVFADLTMLFLAAAALYLGACAEQPPVRRGIGTFVTAG